MTDDRDDIVPPHLASLVGHRCVLNLSVLIKLVRINIDEPGFDDLWLSGPTIKTGTEFLVVDAAVKYDIDENCPLMWLKIVTAPAPDALYGWISVGAVTTPNSRRTPKIQVTPVDT